MLHRSVADPLDIWGYSLVGMTPLFEIKKTSLPADEWCPFLQANVAMHWHTGLKQKTQSRFLPAACYLWGPHEKSTAWWWPYRHPSLSGGWTSQDDHPVVPRQTEEVKCTSRCVLPAAMPPWPTGPQINLEIITLSRWYKGFVTPNKIKRRGPRALGRCCCELEMHIIVSCV